MNGGILCQFCGKRPATRLCDAPVGYTRYIGHPPRHLMQKAQSWDIAWSHVSMCEIVTCDRYLCDRCAVNVGVDIDYCPDCVKRIKIAAAKKGTNHGNER